MRLPLTSRSRPSSSTCRGSRGRSKRSKARASRPAGRQRDHRPHLACGATAKDSPLGRYLPERGVKPGELHTLRFRRGNHEVMMRGTLANIRLRNEIVPGASRAASTRSRLSQGASKCHLRCRNRYKEEGCLTSVIAGKEYGTGELTRLGGEGHPPLGRQGPSDRREFSAGGAESNLVGWACFPACLRPQRAHARPLAFDGSEVIDISSAFPTTLCPARK